MSRTTDDQLTIGRLADAVGVPTSTIRFYERQGLVKPDARTGSNYRTYTSDSAERVKFIRAAQATGFSLKDIREMLALTDAEGPPCRDVAALIVRRLDDVRERLRELQHVERTLAASMASCCTRDEADLCTKIQGLKGRLG